MSFLLKFSISNLKANYFCFYLVILNEGDSQLKNNIGVPHLLILNYNQSPILKDKPSLCIHTIVMLKFVKCYVFSIERGR